MNAFVFNGVNFGTTHNCMVLRTNDLRIPGSNNETLELVGVPGSDKLWPFLGESRAVEIVFPCRIGALPSETEAQFVTRLQNFNAALVTTEFKKLQWFYTSKVWMAMWDREPLQYLPAGTMAVRVLIRFLAQQKMVNP